MGFAQRDLDERSVLGDGLVRSGDRHTVKICDDQGMTELAIAVTGHRSIADVESVSARVGQAIDHLLAASGASTFALWSSLAAGADRIAATGALDRGSALHVVLPLPPDDYAHDFPDSVDEFRALLARAATIEVVAPTSSRDDAYLAAGQRVLEAAEALLAVWSGQAARGRGGTAEIVAAARAADRPLAWVHCANGDDEPCVAGPPITYERLVHRRLVGGG